MEDAGLIVPKNITARPTTDFARENLFNVLDNMMELEGKACLTFCRHRSDKLGVRIAWMRTRDSRGAGGSAGRIHQVCERETRRHIAETHKGDVFRFIERGKEKYDIIFADPPYDHPRFAEIPRTYT